MMAKWMISAFGAMSLVLLAQAQPAVSQNPPAKATQKSVPIPAPSPVTSSATSSASATSTTSASVTVAPNAPPYEGQLLELARALGSLHYLSGLCEAKNTVWRDQMNGLLASEKPDNARQKRLISAFNNSYRSYADNYQHCTPQALRAMARFKQQGETLTSALLARYGN